MGWGVIHTHAPCKKTSGEVFMTTSILRLYWWGHCCRPCRCLGSCRRFQQTWSCRSLLQGTCRPATRSPELPLFLHGFLNLAFYFSARVIRKIAGDYLPVPPSLSTLFFTKTLQLPLFSATRYVWQGKILSVRSLFLWWVHAALWDFFPRDGGRCL